MAESAPLAYTDAMTRDVTVADDVFNALRERYSEQQMIDVVFTVGQYAMVSMALNSFGVQLEDGELR